MIETLLPDLTHWWAWLILLVVALGALAFLADLVDQFEDVRVRVATVVVLELLLVYTGMLLVHAHDMLQPFSWRSAAVLTLVVVVAGGLLAVRGYGQLRRSDWSDEPAARPLSRLVRVRLWSLWEWCFGSSAS